MVLQRAFITLRSACTTLIPASGEVNPSRLRPRGRGGRPPESRPCRCRYWRGLAPSDLTSNRPARRRSGADQVGLAEVGPAGPGRAEVGPSKPGVAEVGGPDGCLAEVGSTEIGSAEIGASEVCTSDIGIVEVGRAELSLSLALRRLARGSLAC